MKGLAQKIVKAFDLLVHRYPVKKLILAVSLSVFILGWLLGMLQGAGVFSGVTSENLQLKAELKALKSSELQSQLKIAKLTTLHNIDSQALKAVAETVRDMESQLANADVELQLYQALMGKYREANNPFVRDVQLFKAPQGRFAYRVIVQRGKSLQNKNTKLGLKVTVTGSMDGKEVFFPLSLIDPAQSSDSEAFNIKYFKLFEGEVMLPAGFTPKEVVTRVWLVGQLSSSSEERFPWQVKSRQ